MLVYIIATQGVLERFGVPGVSGKMVGAPGIEPGTSAMSRRHSNHLSYAPEDIIRALELRGDVSLLRDI